MLILLKTELQSVKMGGLFYSGKWCTPNCKQCRSQCM